MIAIVFFPEEASYRSFRDLVNPLLYFFEKLQWFQQILAEFCGDLAVAASNSRRKSNSFNESVEIYPPEPQHLVTHKYHRENI